MREKGTREPVPAALLYLMELEGEALSDEEGQFLLDLPDTNVPGTLTLTATGTASPLLVHGDNVSSSGVVTPFDLNPANSAVEFSVPVVVDSTDLGMDASGPGTEASVGDVLNYSALATNLGSRPAENVVISVVRPTGTTFRGSRIVIPTGTFRSRCSWRPK